jgi:hypothetical protein
MLKFHTQRPGEPLPKHYLVWVDQESFLPLKVKTYLDTKHQTVSTATDLQTNVMMPADMFRYTPSHNTFQVFGEVEPFVFTMPLDRPRTLAFDEDPTGAAQFEMRRRAPGLKFQPLAPTYLPDGYGLVRVRRSAQSGWLDAYWLHPTTGAVIKLWEQQAGRERPLSDEDGEVVRSGDNPARWREVRHPVLIQYVTWSQGGTLLRLAAAGVERDDALRIAASVVPVEEVNSPQRRREGGEEESGKT